GTGLERLEALVALPAGAAALGRRGAGQEPLVFAPAEEARAQPGGFVDRDALEAGRLAEVLAALGAQRADQEPAEDREGRLRAGEPERRAVVEADPHRRDELGREADEPGVAGLVGGAGLAR